MPSGIPFVNPSRIRTRDLIEAVGKTVKQVDALLVALATHAARYAPSELDMAAGLLSLCGCVRVCSLGFGLNRHPSLRVNCAAGALLLLRLGALLPGATSAIINCGVVRKLPRTLLNCSQRLQAEEPVSRRIKVRMSAAQHLARKHVGMFFSDS